jgi:hypothetical protein
MSTAQSVGPRHGGRYATFWTPLFLAWLLALLATAGALFLGEVMGNTPCVLCWYQRIAMFPLVLVIGMGLFTSDPRGARYSLPLAGVGWGIAAYHLMVFWGVVSEGLVPCGQGSSCWGCKPEPPKIPSSPRRPCHERIQVQVDHLGGSSQKTENKAR